MADDLEPSSTNKLAARVGAMRNRTWAAIAFAVGTVLSLIHAWPLVARRGMLTAIVPGSPREDVLMTMWHLRWFQRVLTSPQNPYATDLLAAPTGTTFYWHDLGLAKALPGAILGWMFGIGHGLNLMTFSTFVLGFFTAWLLLDQILRYSEVERPIAAVAAMAGASVFAFSRYHFTQSLSHLNLAALEGIPLYLFFLIRFLREGRRRDLLGVTLSAVYTALCIYYYILYLALFSVLWLVFERGSRGGFFSLKTIFDRTMLRGAIAGGSVAVALSPLMGMLVWAAQKPYVSSHHGDSDYWADLLHLSFPDSHSRWYAAVPAAVRHKMEIISARLYHGNTEETGAYLAILTVLCALAAGGRTWPPLLRRLLGVGAVFLLLSLGKYLALGGDTRVEPWVPLSLSCLALLVLTRFRAGPVRDVAVIFGLGALIDYFVPFTAEGRRFTAEIPMPFMLAKSMIPLFSKGGMPIRMGMILTLGFGALVAWGAARLLARKSPFGYGAALALALVPNLELAHKWIMVPEPPREPFARIFAGAEGDFRVFSDDNVLAQYDQIFHDRPTSFARLSRTPEYVAREAQQPAFRALASLERLPNGWTDAEVASIRAYLIEHRFRFYTYHLTHVVWPRRASLADDVERFMERLGGEKVFVDRYMHVYRLPDK